MHNHIPTSTSFIMKLDINNHNDSDEFSPQKSTNPTHKILVADDDPFNVMSIEGIINTFNLSIDKCYDGQSALDWISKSILTKQPPYKLVILDNQMPNKTGIQVATEIKQKQKEDLFPEKMRVVLLTSNKTNNIERMIIGQSFDTTRHI